MCPSGTGFICWPSISCYSVTSTPESLPCLDTQGCHLPSSSKQLCRTVRPKQKEKVLLSHTPMSSLLSLPHPALFLSSFWPAVRQQQQLPSTALPTQLVFLRKWGMCNSTASACTLMFPQQPANFQFSFQQRDKRCGEVSKVPGFCKFNVNRWGTLKQRREMLASTQVRGVVEAPPYSITANLHKDLVWITQLRKRRSIWQLHLSRHKALRESYLTGLSALSRTWQGV